MPITRPAGRGRRSSGLRHGSGRCPRPAPTSAGRPRPSVVPTSSNRDGGSIGAQWTPRPTCSYGQPRTCPTGDTPDPGSCYRAVAARCSPCGPLIGSLTCVRTCAWHTPGVIDETWIRGGPRVVLPLVAWWIREINPNRPTCSSSSERSAVHVQPPSRRDRAAAVVRTPPAAVSGAVPCGKVSATAATGCPLWSSTGAATLARPSETSPSSTA